MSLFVLQIWKKLGELFPFRQCNLGIDASDGIPRSIEFWQVRPVQAEAALELAIGSVGFDPAKPRQQLSSSLPKRNRIDGFAPS
jgi:hypothetical protein